MKHHIDYVIETEDATYIYGHTYSDSVLLASWTGKLSDGRMTIEQYRGSINRNYTLEYLVDRRLAVEVGAYQHITFSPTFAIKE